MRRCVDACFLTTVTSIVSRLAESLISAGLSTRGPASVGRARTRPELATVVLLLVIQGAAYSQQADNSKTSSIQPPAGIKQIEPDGGGRDGSGLDHLVTSPFFGNDRFLWPNILAAVRLPAPYGHPSRRLHGEDGQQPGEQALLRPDSISSLSARQAGSGGSPQAPQAAPGTPALGLLTRDQAVQLALAQASAYQQAQLSESSASEDVHQARIAFLPKFAVPVTVTYNSPTSGPDTTPGTPAFLNANSLTEYVAGLGVDGDIDLAGRLRATLRRNHELLKAAHAGTEAARRALVEATDESYFGLALATARRLSAELNLSAAESFEKITGLLLNGGEVASVDLDRARLQTAQRQDELEQAKAAEEAAADALRALVAYDFTRPIAATELMNYAPESGNAEVESYDPGALTARPELIQLDAEIRAAQQDVRIARADRLPQVSYSLNGGFDTGSLVPEQVRQHTGLLAVFSLTIPVFDWGASRSRERQATLRRQSIESERNQAVREFGQQFYSARAQVFAARARVTVARNAVQTAERAVDTSIQRYKAGEAPILEVTDAQTTLAGQRAALSQAVFDYQVGLSRLRQATGK